MATVSDIAIRAGYIPGLLSVIAERPNQPITTEWSLHPEVINLIFKLWGTLVVDMFATFHNLHLSSVYVSRSGATSTGNRCSVTRLAEAVDVHVAAVKVILKLKTTQGGELILIAPWCPSQLVSTLTTTVCEPPSILSVPLRPTFTTSGKSYHLHAWRLSCSTTKQQDF